MAFFQDIPRELKRGILASGLFHLALLALFVMIQVGRDVAPLQFAEVAFIAGTPGGASTASTLAGASSPSRDAREETAAASPALQPQRRQPAKPAPLTQKPQSATQRAFEPPHRAPVTPPKRRMLEDEKPLLGSQEEGKITPGRNPAPVAAAAGAVAAPGSGSATDSGAEPAGRQGSSAGGAGQGRSGTGTGSGITPGEGSGQPFTIEGDAAQRLILKQVIPAYPEGLQQEAVIQFKFTVQPDGRLSGLIPMRKGDPTLEKITLTALRQWLFSPLPAQAVQRPVQGIITFRYQLE
ncbi:MAG TPA: energy transducer TonB [bacterium]|nr:energy transducer TonB [bacterium]HPR87919.1 energy transducer TonB [bacterium]